jgi:hypothetical protein
MPLAGPPAQPLSALPDAARLAQEADRQLRAAVDHLNPSAAAALPTADLLCLIRLLAVVATQRPQLLGKAVPALLALAVQVRCQPNCVVA